MSQALKLVDEVVRALRDRLREVDREFGSEYVSEASISVHAAPRESVQKRPDLSF